MLYKKTGIYYTNELHELQEKGYIKNGEKSVLYLTVEKNYNKEKVMIITEGLVFLLLLLFLVFKVKNSIEKEIEFSRKQQNFILSITHELKSPLSSIKLMSQTLKRHNLKEEQKEQLINNSLSEVDRLQNLVENVLLAAKIDNHGYGFSKNDINISDLSQKMVLRCEAAHHVTIRSSIEPDIHLKADLSAFTSILINLIENAIKYSVSEPAVQFELFKKEHYVFIRVADNGQGIPDEEKAKVFDKFYRVGNEEVRATKGTGLGLYIVSKLVTFHNGTVHVKDNEPQGTVFELIFEL